MKKIILISFLVVTSFRSYCQWQIIPFPGSGTYIYKVYDLCFLNDSIGFAVIYFDNGTPSIILKTTNSGNSWVSDTIPSPVKDIEFISADTGYAMGWGGVYRTIDQGDSWQLLNTLSPWVDLRCMKFVNHHVAFAGGTHSLCNSCHAPSFLKTTDGWITYDTIVHPIVEYVPNYINGVLGSIYFADDLHGYAVGGIYMLRTDDGGANWYYEDGFQDYGALSLGGKGSLVLGGYQDVPSINCTGIYYSHDYGSTWTPVSCNPSTGIDTAGNLYDITMVTDSFGYAVGGPQNGGAGGGRGSVLITQDGSNSWSSDTIPESQLINTGYFFSINCPTPQTCYCGGGGVIMKKTNADYGTGINEQLAVGSKQIGVYPNPTTNNFTVQTTHRGKLIMLNQLGQIIYTTQIDKDKTQISTNNFPRGIYFVQLVTNKNIFTQKIILQ